MVGLWWCGASPLFLDHCWATGLTHLGDHFSIWFLLFASGALLLSTSGGEPAQTATAVLLPSLACIGALQVCFPHFMERLIYAAVPLGALSLGAALWWRSAASPEARRLALFAGAGAVVTAALQNPATLGIATPVRAWYLNTHA